MFLVSLHRLGSESLTRMEAHKKAVHYQRSHLTWERTISQSLVVSTSGKEPVSHWALVKGQTGIASGGRNRHKILNGRQDFESRSSPFLPAQLLLSIYSLFLQHAPPCLFSFLSFFFFSLRADSESWLAPALLGDMVIPDHHFRAPRDRSQHWLFFPAFTKRAALNYSVFLDLPPACPSGIYFHKRIPSQRCRPS